jgi:capsular polysaccharide transport system permease protein
MDSIKELPPLQELELVAVPLPEGVSADEDEVDRVDDVLPRRHRWALFLVLVVLPVTVAAAYFGLIASDVYVSQAQFIVRSMSFNDASGLVAFAQNQGLSRATEETFAVNEYVRSRDSVDFLVVHDDLRTILARPEADLFNRFPNFFSRNTREALFRHFRSMVSADVEGKTGISRLEVEAFRPGDALNLAKALLAAGEQLVNRMNERAYENALADAQRRFDEARQTVANAERRLTEFRQREHIVDSGREATAALEAIGRMSMELAQQEADLDRQLRLSPSAPAIRPLRQKIDSYRRQIELERAKIVGGTGAIAEKMADYEALVLERELAAKALGVAMLEMEKARQAAQVQHLYLQTIAEPNLPDYPLYPRRILGFLAVTGLALLVWWITLSITRIVMEHRA